MVEVARALLVGDLAHPSAPLGVAAALGNAAVGLLVGRRATRRAAA